MSKTDASGSNARELAFGVFATVLWNQFRGGENPTPRTAVLGECAGIVVVWTRLRARPPVRRPAQPTRESPTVPRDPRAPRGPKPARWLGRNRRGPRWHRTPARARRRTVRT